MDGFYAVSLIMLKHCNKHVFLTFLVAGKLLMRLYHDYIYIQEGVIHEKPSFIILNPYSKAYSCKIGTNYTKLINIDFKFLSNPKVCNNQPFLLVIVVFSAADHFENRQILREMCVSDNVTKLVFLLGIPSNSSIVPHIDSESKTHNDIVQGNFMDHYRNLSYKHLMGLKWVTHHCTTAKYVLKLDDDTYFDKEKLIQFLARQLSPWGAEGLIGGTLNRYVLANRGNSKWNVTREEYDSNVYPPYCSGAFILYSSDVLAVLVEASEKNKFFFIEDVYVTGILASNVRYKGVKTSIFRTDMLFYSFLFLESYELKLYLYGPYDLSIEDMRKLWAEYRLKRLLRGEK